MDVFINFPSSRLGEVVMEKVAGRRVTVVVLLVVGTGTTARLIRWLYRCYRLGEKRRLKKQQCQLALDALDLDLREEGQISPGERTEILALSFSDLQTRLKTGRLSPLQVLRAFQLQALDAHKKTNCLVEPIKEAQLLSSELDDKNRTILPLYGIPISIKDSYGVENYDSTLGLAQWVDRPFAEDCVVVKVLRLQGAIPFMKTNVPQAMMSGETSNPIFGVTTHPLNDKFTPGGSTGGEGALLAAGGSILGFGTDLLGSIRIPAAFSGVCGLKPTQGRISLKGAFPFMDGQTLMKISFGPMAREVDGLVAAMRALLVPFMFQLDSSLPPLPFSEQLFNNRKTLKIGYYTYDGYTKAVPACERAVNEAIQALKRRGHQVLEFNFSKYTSRIMGPVWTCTVGDGGCDVLGMIACDKIDPTLKSTAFMLSLGIRWKKLMATIMGLIYPKVGNTIRALCGCSSVNEWWRLAESNEALREEVLADWKGLGLDVVISPGASTPALPHGVATKCLDIISYSAVYNLLAFPVGSVPVSKVTASDVELMENYPTPDPSHKIIKQAQVGTEGLPVGVQVAALPWHDELCLRVMKELESALKHR